MNVRKSVIVQRHAKHDGHRAVGQPVRDRDAQAFQKAQGAGGLVAEHRQPGQGLAPGRDHVGDDNQHAQQLLSGDVRSGDEPAENASQRDADQYREEAADQ